MNQDNNESPRDISISNLRQIVKESRDKMTNEAICRIEEAILESALCGLIDNYFIIDYAILNNLFDYFTGSGFIVVIVDEPFPVPDRSIDDVSLITDPRFRRTACIYIKWYRE